MDVRKSYLKQIKKKNRKKLKIKRKIHLETTRPRLCIYKSCKNLYAQIIDDQKQVTLCSSSTIEKGFKTKKVYRCNKKNAKIIGERLAKRAIEKNITTVVLDRNSYMYHGIIKVLADICRENGLIF